MKRTDLAKSLNKKIQVRMQHAATPDRFGAAANTLPDRREQRRLDQAAGLVPFAVKLHHELATRLTDLAAREGVSLSELTARLIQAGLGAAPATPDATAAAPEKKAAENKASVKKTAESKTPEKKTPEKKATATKADKAPAKKAAATPKTEKKADKKTEKKTDKAAPAKKAAAPGKKAKAA